MPKKINQDGKQYTFIPGKGGSLYAPAPKSTGFNLHREPVAKTIPSATAVKALDKADKRRKKQKDAQVAGSRG